MTEKRFRVFKYPDASGMYGVSDDIAEYTVAYFDNNIEAEHLCNLLNKQEETIKHQDNKILQLHIENHNIKATIEEAITNERTMIGKSVLKQLLEQME